MKGLLSTGPTPSSFSWFMYICRLLALRNPLGTVEVGLSKFDKHFEYSECVVEDIF